MLNLQAEQQKAEIKSKILKILTKYQKEKKTFYISDLLSDLLPKNWFSDENSERTSYYEETILLAVEEVLQLSSEGILNRKVKKTENLSDLVEYSFVSGRISE